MFLGLDLGTSGVKAVLIDDTQTLCAEGHGALTVSRPHPGWSEQQPDHWIEAAKTAIAALAAGQDLSSVAAIGLSGQMHGATLLDAQDRALRPAILWNDTRAHAEAAQLDADPRFRATSGNIVFPGFTAPKLLWVRHREPEVFAQTAKVLLPKDYLRLWLTGTHVTDMSDAAGTSWLDTGRRDWSDDLLSATGMSRAQMPDLVEGSAISGTLRPEVASRFGMRSGIPVAGGAGDNAASAIGMGVTEPGQGFVSLGTSGVLFAPSAGYAPAPDSALHSFCHALPGYWHQMGVILAASDALTWFANFVGSTPAALTADLGSLRAPGRTLFLPYLGGERTPHNDAQVRGALLGLDHATDGESGVRAVLEGVSFALRDCLDAMQQSGTRLDGLIAVGGGARSDYWLRVLATVLELPIDVPAKGDFGAAFGAARLAMMAAGQGGHELAKPPRIDRTIDPDPGLTDAFSAAHKRYQSAYAALRSLS
ncbi:xylulokinase [Cognatishimia sp. F0-27]|uniref:xylulokinase n=1 Tax=Cognatishimia sp. F0-27 TaxID=2816855 RepID=UPI001D0C06D3|nr:xylulokinase [Cognatishimia sp. F0-27]MCC1492655.1 xylulokinase [Cognatishimia sp. F0-27]